MTRVKRGTTSLKRRKNVLAQVKGYRFGRSTKEAAAREAIVHAGKYAFNHRRDKKRDFRAVWQTQISAAVRPTLSYSKFMGMLKKAHIELNRKMLATLAQEQPETFAAIVKKVS